MRKCRAAQRGSIYTEALVSVAILTVAILPIFGSFLLGPRVQDETGRRTVALAIARSHLERLHALSGPDWDGLSGRQSTPDAEHTEYLITRESLERAGLPTLKDITVTVTWQDARGRPQTLTLVTAVARRADP